jgi:nucleoid-associated protein YgaU
MINLNQYLTGASPYDSAYVLKYRDGEYSLETDPPLVPHTSKDKQHTIKEGETLQNLAFAAYGDSGKWYLIAEANQIIDPFTEVVPGKLLRIPMYGN